MLVVAVDDDDGQVGSSRAMASAASRRLTAISVGVVPELAHLAAVLERTRVLVG